MIALRQITMSKSDRVQVKRVQTTWEKIESRFRNWVFQIENVIDTENVLNLS